MYSALDKVENKGRAEGRKEAVALALYLIDHNRQDDLKKLSDADYYDKLLIEMHSNN